jgi:hypothetical protein
MQNMLGSLSTQYISSYGPRLSFFLIFEGTTTLPRSSVLLVMIFPMIFGLDPVYLGSTIPIFPKASNYYYIMVFLKFMLEDYTWDKVPIVYAS